MGPRILSVKSSAHISWVPLLSVLFLLPVLHVLQVAAIYYDYYDAYPLHTLKPCSDYEMLIVNTKQCVSRCPVRCINGVCFEDGVCPCEGSYVNHPALGLVCAADCLPGCKEAGGYCAAPEVCLCRRKGLYFNVVARRCLPYFISIFKDRCKGQCLYGKCTPEGVCVCATGYVHRDTLLGQRCTPVCTQDCGRHGYCFLPNICACRKKHYHYERDGKCHKDYLYLGSDNGVKPFKWPHFPFTESG